MCVLQGSRRTREVSGELVSSRFRLCFDSFPVLCCCLAQPLTSPKQPLNPAANASAGPHFGFPRSLRLLDSKAVSHSMVVLFRFRASSFLQTCLESPQTDVCLRRSPVCACIPIKNHMIEHVSSPLCKTPVFFYCFIKAHPLCRKKGVEYVVRRDQPDLPTPIGKPEAANRKTPPQQKEAGCCVLPVAWASLRPRPSARKTRRCALSRVCP